MAVEVEENVHHIVIVFVLETLLASQHCRQQSIVMGIVVYVDILHPHLVHSVLLVNHFHHLEVFECYVAQFHPHFVLQKLTE